MKIFLPAVICLFLSSCYSYKIFPTKGAVVKTDMPRKKAYVRNPELQKEYSILFKSNIFEIVTEGGEKADLEIELHPLESGVGCSGTAMPLPVLTLGQLPQTIHNVYTFSFSEITKEGMNKKKINLNIGQQIWFWHLLQFKKNFEGKAGKLLNMEFK